VWPISERFAEALQRDHRIVAKAEILEGEQVVYDFSNADTNNGILVDGSVSCSRSAIQRTASCTIVDQSGTLTPRDVRDLLVPGGRQIRLWRGIMFNDIQANGEPDIEYVPLGTFRFTQTTVEFPKIQLESAYDRSWIISGEKTPFILSIANNTNIIDTITQLVQTAYFGVPMNLPITNEGVNGMVFDAGADPWEVCQTLAANVGQRLFFDPMGVLQMRPEPNETDPAVWSFDDLDDSNIGLPTVGRTWQGDGYNGVIVTASNSDLAAPLFAIAVDGDPNSPTQWGGPFGKRYAPFIKDETIASQAQAQLRANKELQANLGFLQSIKVPALPNPAFEVGDVVRVALARSDITDDPIIDEQYCIVDAFEVPLRASGTQTLTTRARRIVPVTQ
jgi:hypothetical protein